MRRVIVNKISVFLLMLILPVLSVFSQQDPQFNQILFNPLSINPGFAGSQKNMIGVGAINRIQWSGFGEGAPLTTNLGINAPIAPFGFKSGVGLSILNDRFGFNSDIGLNLSYAARFNIKKVDGNLGVGVGVGFINNSINPTWNYPAGGTDDAIPDQKESSINLDLSAGLFYNTDYMFFGVSALHINETKMNKAPLSARYTRQFYLTGGYIIDFAGNNWQYEPSVLIHTDLKMNKLAINSIVRYNKKFWGGVSYRVAEALTAMVGFELFNGVKIGYAYEFSLTKISKYNDGSHEFYVGYNFQLKKEKPPQQYKSLRFL
ncbi:MAG: hypothetical protein PWR03_88 [Tenuifilum sp.]|uniref:PorP/SprF family type IX secretion system membrane protein n=1 Tax=Tenuifilum sp. TaxID=2760880 RepID=UPI0024ABE04B|nr:PorP/SprF family type IX secretion system membrane protein [Tenuifilum sp.]MDI3525905.1 hypothetical protein [Tenuifilum sp.]